jgi:hypothetical protein
MLGKTCKTQSATGKEQANLAAATVVAAVIAAAMAFENLTLSKGLKTSEFRQD